MNFRYLNLHSFLLIALLCTVFCFLGCQAKSGHAPTIIGDNYNYTEPVLVPVHGYSGHVMEPFLSRDDRFLFFNNLNNLKKENTDIHWASQNPDGSFQYKGRVQGVNTKELEGVPSLDEQGNFYFVSTRSYGKTRSTLYQGKFHDGRVSQVKIVAGNFVPNPLGTINMDAEISADGEFLLTTVNKMSWFIPGFPKTSDFIFLKKSGDAFVLDSDFSNRIFKEINHPDYLEYAASLSLDTLTLYYSRLDVKSVWKGSPKFDLLKASRSKKGEPFGHIERIQVLNEGFFEAPAVSRDGTRLYFHKKVKGLFQLHLIRQKPLF